jgi:hypothetical protein
MFLSFRSSYSPQNNSSSCSTVLSAYGIKALRCIAELLPCWLYRWVEMECCTLRRNEWIRGSNDTDCCQSANPSPYMNKTLVLWYSVETFSYTLASVMMVHFWVHKHYLTVSSKWDSVLTESSSQVFVNFVKDMNKERREVWIIFIPVTYMPITVAPQSKAWTVFARSNTGIVGSNPIWGMDVYVRFILCLCCPVCSSGLATGGSPVQGVLRTV